MPGKPGRRKKSPRVKSSLTTESEPVTSVPAIPGPACSVPVDSELAHSCSVQFPDFLLDGYPPEAIPAAHSEPSVPDPWLSDTFARGSEMEEGSSDSRQYGQATCKRTTSVSEEEGSLKKTRRDPASGGVSEVEPVAPAAGSGPGGESAGGSGGGTLVWVVDGDDTPVVMSSSDSESGDSPVVMSGDEAPEVMCDGDDDDDEAPVVLSGGDESPVVVSAEDEGTPVLSGDESSDAAAVVSPSAAADGAEEVVIRDTVFSDSEDCVVLDYAGGGVDSASGADPAPAPAQEPAPSAEVFGLDRMVQVSADSVLLTTRPQFSLYIWGAYNLRVLCGALNLHGAVLTPEHADPVPVYSLRVKSLLALRSARCGQPGTDAAAADAAVCRLRQLVAHLPAEAEAALRHCGGCALLVSRLETRLLQLLNARYADQFVPDCQRHPAEQQLAPAGCLLVAHRQTADRLHLELHTITDQWTQLITGMVDHAKQQVSGQLRVVMAGGKGVGKSTWLYYTLNSLLNTRPYVYILDLDPGQAEFTPCGCLSLVQVREYLAGPAFTHLTHPLRCIFTGEVSVAEDPAGYMHAVDSLIATYRHIAKTDPAPLLVNTMGWAQDLGEDLLMEILGKIQPTDVVEIAHPSQSHVNFGRPLTSARVSGHRRGWVLSQYLQPQGLRVTGPEVTYRHTRVNSLRPKPSGHVKQGLAPWMFRQLSTTACIAALETDQRRLSQLTPVCVPWSSLAVHVRSPEVRYEHVMHAVNATVVALCWTSPAVWRPPADRSLFSSLPPSHSPPDCHGFGLVRGVDVERRLLYLLTDLPPAALSQVNTLVRGPHHLLDLFSPADWTPALTSNGNQSNPLAQPGRRRKVAAQARQRRRRPQHHPQQPG